MKSLVIAVDLKIIVSLNCLKANKAQLNTMHSKKKELPALITPSTATSLSSLMLSEQTRELSIVLTHSTKKGKIKTFS